MTPPKSALGLLLISDNSASTTTLEYGKHDYLEEQKGSGRNLQNPTSRAQKGGRAYVGEGAMNEGGRRPQTGRKNN